MGDLVVEAPARFPQTSFCGTPRPSLGSRRYFTALTHVDAVIGNSSSGLYEAPTFAVATVNVGDRQKGRLRATSVIDCVVDVPAIVKAIEKAFLLDCSSVQNPYGDGHAAERIIRTLQKIGSPARLLQKRFVELA